MQCLNNFVIIWKVRTNKTSFKFSKLNDTKSVKKKKVTSIKYILFFNFKKIINPTWYQETLETSKNRYAEETSTHLRAHGYIILSLRLLLNIHFYVFPILIIKFLASKNSLNFNLRYIFIIKSNDVSQSINQSRKNHFILV